MCDSRVLARRACEATWWRADGRQFFTFARGETGPVANSTGRTGWYRKPAYMGTSGGVQNGRDEAGWDIFWKIIYKARQDGLASPTAWVPWSIKISCPAHLWFKSNNRVNSNIETTEKWKNKSSSSSQSLSLCYNNCLKNRRKLIKNFLQFRRKIIENFLQMGESHH